MASRAVLELLRPEGTTPALGGDLDAVVPQLGRRPDCGSTELLTYVIDGVSQRLIGDLALARYRLGLFARITGRRIKSEGQLQVILVALKKYGMMVADNGSNWFISGAPDPRWNNNRLVNELRQVPGSNFEVVKMVGIVTP